MSLIELVNNQEKQAFVRKENENVAWLKQKIAEEIRVHWVLKARLKSMISSSQFKISSTIDLLNTCIKWFTGHLTEKTFSLTSLSSSVLSLLDLSSLSIVHCHIVCKFDQIQQKLISSLFEETLDATTLAEITTWSNSYSAFQESRKLTN